MASDLNSRTIGGLNAYCDWLLDKHYAGPSQVGPWKVAIRKVFEAINGPEFEAVSLDGLDMEDVVRRFRVSAAQTYKSETMDAYIARVQRAMEAFDYWHANGKPPVFRQVAKKGTDAEGKAQPKPKAKSPAKAKPLKAVPNASEHDGATVDDPEPEPGFIEYPFPLRNGQVAKLKLPQRLEKLDVDRLVQYLHALQYEPQQQIPERTGESRAA